MEARVTKHDADRKVRILDFIAATLRAAGYPPSVREIARAVGLSLHIGGPPSPPDPRARGLPGARRRPVAGDPPDPDRRDRARSVDELVPQSAAAEAHLLPIIGEIAAGGPIEAYQDASETMAVPDVLAPSGDAYVLGSGATR